MIPINTVIFAINTCYNTLNDAHIKSNEDILLTAKETKRIDDEYYKGIADLRKSYLAMYDDGHCFNDPNLTVAGLKVIIRLNVKYRLVPLHQFGITIELPTNAGLKG